MSFKTTKRDCALRTAGLSGAVITLGWATAVMAQTQAAKPADDVAFTLTQLNAVKTAVQASDGASSYDMPQGLIDALPGGDDASMKDILLQTPGVVLEAYNHIHVRGDYDNLQYRLNGIVLPQDLSVFAQFLSPKIARNVEIMTGALPAEYGLRNAGVIDITTKKNLMNGGEVSLYGGSHGTFSPSLSYGGKINEDSFFGALNTTTSQQGLEAPSNTRDPKHDRTQQALGFGYYDHFIDDTSHLTFIAGASAQRFQLPDVSGLNSSTDGEGFSVAGRSNYLSDHIDSNQREAVGFGVISYSKVVGYLNLSVSLNARNSDLAYRPDVDPEIAFNGIAPDVREKDRSYGLQAEAVYTANPAHALKTGVQLNGESSTSRVNAAVLLLDGAGNPTSQTPTYILDTASKWDTTYSLYASDTWTLTPNFTLIYGLRYDAIDAGRDESQLSPRINFVWAVDPTITVHGGYSRFFTPPPFELVTRTLQARLASTSGDISGPNTAPYAERDNYLDLGVRKQFSKALSLGIGAYYRAATRLVQEDQLSSPLLLVPYNFQDGRNLGLELTASYTRGPVTAYANYALARAVGRKQISSEFNFDPVELAYTNNHYVHLDNDQTQTASGGIVYKWKATRLSLDGFYGSGLREDSPVGIPGAVKDKPYSQVNLSVAHQFGGDGGLNARLDVINLFDQAYELGGGTGIGTGGAQWGPRRGVYIGLAKAL